MRLKIGTFATLLQVFDMPSSLRFYRDVLGFEVVSKVPPDDQCDWVMLALNGSELMLNTAYESKDRPPTPDPTRIAAHSDVILYFDCDDVDSAHAYLREHNVDAKAPTVASYGMKQVYVKDPDGYQICLQHPVSEQAPRARSTEGFTGRMSELARSVAKGVPMIYVPDVAQALDWYVAIGFKELNRFDDDGLVNFGLVALGNAELMLNMHGRPAPHDVSLWFYTDRVDAMYEALKLRRREVEQSELAGTVNHQLGIEFEQDVEDMFYGARQFCIRDLNGYQLYFIGDRK